jgi:very-short-patch-repair endonuclease
MNTLITNCLEINPANNKNIKDVILIILNNSTPLTVTELRIKLQNQSFRLRDYEILSELRSLQKEGLIRIERGRWCPQSPTNYRLTPIQERNINLPPILNRQWSPSLSEIINDDINLRKFEAETKEKRLNLGPWDTFRKLLGYYSDCIRNDEGCEVRGFLEDYKKSFLFLNQVGNWYPRSGQPWERTFLVGPDLQLLIKRLISEDEDGVLVLGYPFQIFSRCDGHELEYVFVTPIFTYQLEWQMHDHTLRVFNQDPCPEVSLNWLSFSLRKPEEQKLFLSMCGLMDRGRKDESMGDGSKYYNSPDLKSLARGLATFFAEKIKEPLRPESVSSLPFFARPQSGIYNKAVLMVGQRTKYTRSLLKELSRISHLSDSELDKTALKFIFKTNSPEAAIRANGDNSLRHNQYCHEGTVVDTDPLNDEQRRAVASLLKEEISVITGPPGTGKSQVVSAAMANARLNEETAVFTSRMHKALDSVVGRLQVDGHSLIVRANSKDDPLLNFGFEHALSQLFVDEYDVRFQDKWKNVREQIDSLLQKRGELGIEVDKVQALEEQLGDLEQQMSYLADNFSTQTFNELNENAEHFPFKMLRKLESSIGSLRQYTKIPNAFNRMIYWFKSFFIIIKLRLLNRSFQKYYPSKSFFIPKMGYYGLSAFSKELPSILTLSEFCKIRIKAKPLENALKLSTPFEELTPKIKKLSEQLANLAPKALVLHMDLLKGLPKETNREKLANLKSALRGLNQPVSDEVDRKTTQSALEASLLFLLQHFPLWVVTNLSIRNRIPLVPGLFDLAIIDEASQCDIPSAIPILFRATRVGIVGDPHQLSHSTKLTRTKDALLRKRHALVELSEQRFSYPDTSLYDLFAQTNGINPIVLKETYRSVEEIADYSNQNFYGGNLRVATIAKKLNIPKGVRPGIQWTEIVSEIRTGGPSGCFAIEEAEAVLNLIKIILIENNFEGTLGVVTPFRQQANRISDLIHQEIPFDVRRSAQLIADTAHGFQGDERDVMIMSLCAGPEMPHGSKGFLRETANLMNVAVSRARAVLHIVGNKQWAAQSGIRHIENLTTTSQYLYRRSDPVHTRWYPHESPWEKILYEALRKESVIAEIQYPVLGRRLDLALIRKEGKEIKIDIEVDGDRCHRNPDGSRKRDDVWRDIQLIGAGWKVMRFWVYQLREDLGKCVIKILKVWRENE